MRSFGWMRTVLLAAVLAGSALVAACSNSHAGPPVVEEAWIREAPPGAATLAGYFTLHYDGSQSMALIGVDGGEHFERVELHSTSLEDGLVVMRQIPNIMLSPGQAMEFAPGGVHLMLVQPRQELRAGDSVSLQLLFSDGQQVSVPFEVRDIRGLPELEPRVGPAPQPPAESHDHH